jgi:hypothetical protein
MSRRFHVPGKEHVNRDLIFNFADVREGDKVHEVRRDLSIEESI